MAIDPLRRAHTDGLRLQEAIEAALGADQAALGRFRAAPAAAGAPPGESADWLEVRNALAGKLAALDALLQERKGSGDGLGGAPPPRSVWRKR